MQAAVASLMEKQRAPKYTSVLRSVHIEFKAGEGDVGTFSLEPNVAIANIKLGGNWDACHLYINARGIDSIYKETGETGFDILSNGKFTKHPITLSIEQNTIALPFSIDYDVVDGRDGDYEYLYKFNEQARKNRYAATGTRSVSLPFRFMVAELSVFSDNDMSAMDDLQLVVREEGTQRCIKTVPFAKAHNCWVLNFEELQCFSSFGAVFLEFTSTSAEENAIRVHARSVNVFDVCNGGCGPRFRC